MAGPAAPAMATPEPVGREHLLHRPVADEVARRSPAGRPPSPRRRRSGARRTVVPWVNVEAGGCRRVRWRTAKDRRAATERGSRARDRRPGVKKGIDIGSGRLSGRGSTARAHRFILLAALLDVATYEVLGVGLEDLVDLVEEIVELGLELLATLSGTEPALRPLPLRFVRGRGFLSSAARSAIVACSSRTQSLEQLGRCVALVDQATHVSAVPRSGSIIGTRRSGSPPMSKTSESQLAATMSSGHFGQAPAAEVGTSRGRAARSVADSTSSSLIRRFHSDPGEQRPCPDAGRGTAGRSPGAGRRPRSGRGAPGSRRPAGTWPPSRAAVDRLIGSVSSAVEHRLPASSTSAPTSSPTDARPRSSAVLPARSKSSHCMSRAGSLRPSLSGSELSASARSHDTSWRIACTGLAEDEIVAARTVVFDHRQHDRRGAHLQEGGDLATSWRRRRSRGGGGTSGRSA